LGTHHENTELAGRVMHTVQDALVRRCNRYVLPAGKRHIQVGSQIARSAPRSEHLSSVRHQRSIVVDCAVRSDQAGEACPKMAIYCNLLQSSLVGGPAVTPDAILPVRLVW
jgi:hypothetical protein